MRIGFVIGRIGGVDSVALEAEKWIEVLQRMGHQISVVTGQLKCDIDNAALIPEMSFDHPGNVLIQEKAFFGAPTSEHELLSDLEHDAHKIEQGVLRWIRSENLDCVVVENACSLPFHLSLGWALKRVFEQINIPVVAHDHVFVWERGGRYETPYTGVQQIIDDCYPLILPNVQHAVINRFAQETLASRLGINDAVVVPNVMDFDRPFAIRDHYNADLPFQLGTNPNDILIFQNTRIVQRMGIEIAVELIHALNDPSIKLVITGTANDEHGDEYIRELEIQTRNMKLDHQVLFAGRRFDSHRGQTPGRRKIYSLADGYAHATACTFFALTDSFGNTFVESVAARRPVFVNNYEPVYWPNIGSLGFKTVQIEDGELTDEAVEAIRNVLIDPQLQRSWTDHNYEIARENFSFQSLRRCFSELFPECG